MPPKKTKRPAAPKSAPRKAGRASRPPRTAKAKSISPAEALSRYIDRVPESSRQIFDKLRATVRAAAPRLAEEIISYSIPALRHDGVTVWYAAFSKHCSLFPGSSLIEAHADKFRGCTTSKGTIQFSVEKPLPTSAIKAIVRERFAERSRKR